MGEKTCAHRAHMSVKRAPGRENVRTVNFEHWQPAYEDVIVDAQTIFLYGIHLEYFSKLSGSPF